MPDKKTNSIEKKPEEVVIEVSQKADENQDVTVELDEKGQAVKRDDGKQAKEEPKYVKVEDLEKERRRIAYEVRHSADEDIKRIKAEIEDLKKSQSSVSKPEIPADEWDAKVQKDWKGTVRELARLELEESLKAERSRQETLIAEQRRIQISQAKQKEVLTKHPELNDASSEKANIFREIVEKNPDYVNDPFGPVLAMRDMEDILRAEGKLIDEPTRKIVDKETSRIARTNATSGANGVPSGKQKVILTKEDRDLCDSLGISYDSYAASRNEIRR